MTHWSKHASRRAEAQVAFEILMTHGLQFALLIALCCVLHRYESQDIHRWEFNVLYYWQLKANQRVWVKLINLMYIMCHALLIRHRLSFNKYYDWSFRRFTYGNLVTTSPSSKRPGLQSFVRRMLPCSREKKGSPSRSKLVGATGGVYKGQGRNQRRLMTCAY